MKTKNEIKKEYKKFLNRLTHQKTLNEWTKGYMSCLRWVLNEPIILKPILTKKAIKELNLKNTKKFSDVEIMDKNGNYIY